MLIYNIKNSIYRIRLSNKTNQELNGQIEGEIKITKLESESGAGTESSPKEEPILFEVPNLSEEESTSKEEAVFQLLDESQVELEVEFEGEIHSESDKEKKEAENEVDNQILSQDEPLKNQNSEPVSQPEEADIIVSTDESNQDQQQQRQPQQKQKQQPQSKAANSTSAKPSTTKKFAQIARPKNRTTTSKAKNRRHRRSLHFGRKCEHNCCIAATNVDLSECRARQ